MECPQCSAAMDSRGHEFDDGEILDVLECGSCGYAEWHQRKIKSREYFIIFLFEGDAWTFEVTGTHLPAFRESEGRERRGGAGAPHRARRD